MTVSYTKDVVTARKGAFFRLLFRWRGSVYKLIWKDFLLFVLFYLIVRFVYRGLLNKSQKRIFEEICKYANSYSSIIPISLVIGFYVKEIFSRWQAMFNSVTWPDRMAMAVTANIKGIDDRGRLIRRTIVRYMILGYIMNQTSICPSVKRRFPTLNHITQAGLMTPQEEKIIKEIPDSKVNKYAIPFLWTVSVICLARKEGRIYNDYAVSVLNKELMDFRAGLGKLLRYYAVSFPLVYTQAITIAVYMLVIFILFGLQFLEPREDGGEGDEDHVVNVGALLQFYVYVGWLKVAEMMINPFGDDDDDFDMNSLIDRNIEYCYLIVDDLHADLPPLEKDMYWDRENFTLPYTVALVKNAKKVNTEVGSAETVTVPEGKSEFVSGTIRLSVELNSAKRRSVILIPDSERRRRSTIAEDKDEEKHQKVAAAEEGEVGRSKVLHPMKFLQSMEHQLRTFDSSHADQPFDNRFLERDHEVDNGYGAYSSSVGSGLFRTSTGFVSGAYTGMKRAVNRGLRSAPESHQKTDSPASSGSSLSPPPPPSPPRPPGPSAPPSAPRPPGPSAPPSVPRPPGPSAPPSAPRSPGPSVPPSAPPSAPRSPGPSVPPSAPPSAPRSPGPSAPPSELKGK